jgi:hypothetical protein
MDSPHSPVPDYISIDFERARIKLGRNEQRLREQAKSFHEDGERFFATFKTSFTEGRVEGSLEALLRIEELAMVLYAEPITSLVRSGTNLLCSSSSFQQLIELVPRLETAFQGTVNLLRSEGLLEETARIQLLVTRPIVSFS